MDNKEIISKLEKLDDALRAFFSDFSKSIAETKMGLEPEVSPEELIDPDYLTSEGWRLVFPSEVDYTLVKSSPDYTYVFDLTLIDGQIRKLKCVCISNLLAVHHTTTSTSETIITRKRLEEVIDAWASGLKGSEAAEAAEAESQKDILLKVNVDLEDMGWRKVSALRSDKPGMKYKHIQYKMESGVKYSDLGVLILGLSEKDGRPYIHISAENVRDNILESIYFGKNWFEKKMAQIDFDIKIKQPKVGDWGYFWDGPDLIIGFSQLDRIIDDTDHRYVSLSQTHWKHFSVDVPSHLKGRIEKSKGE